MVRYYGDLSNVPVHHIVTVCKIVVASKHSFKIAFPGSLCLDNDILVLTLDDPSNLTHDTELRFLESLRGKVSEPFYAHLVEISQSNNPANLRIAMYVWCGYEFTRDNVLNHINLDLPMPFWPI